MKQMMRVTSLVLVCTLFLVNDGVAQNVQGVPVQMTLDDAIRIAMSNNPGYLQANNNLRLNRTNTLLTWGNTLLPRVSLSVLRTSVGGNVVQTAFDNFGNPIQNPDSEWRYSSSSNQSLNFSWGFTGTSLFRNHREMQLTNEGREIQFETQTNQIERTVKQQFLSVQQSQFQLQLQDMILVDRQRDLITTERRRALGQGTTRIDVRLAELAIKQQEQTIATQRRTLQLTLLTLRATLGDSGLGPIEIVPTPIAVFEPSGLDAEALVLVAQTSSPQARSAENTLENQALSLTNVKQNAWIPSFTSSLRLGRGINARDLTGALFEVADYPDGKDLSFTLTLSFPIFSNYFQTKQQLTQAQVNYENQEATYRQTQLDFERTVRSGYQNLVSQYEALVLAVESGEIAADALRLARDAYAIGASSFDQLQQSVTGDANARRDVINAQYSFITNFINLENAIGLPVPVGDAAYARALAELGDISTGGIGLGAAGGN